jgi:hypothetical protein
MPESIAVIEPNPTIIESHPPPKEVGKLGTTPQKSSFAEKFRTEFAKLEGTAAPPKDEPAATKTDPSTDPVEAREVPKPEPTEKVTTKPESPLDVVLEKGTKEPEKVEEPDVLKQFEDINVPKSEHWKRARGVMADQSAKIREYEAKLKAVDTAPKSDPATATRLQELEAALADRETRLKAAGAEYSPDYQALVGKYQAAAEKIKTRMDSFGGDGNSLLTALSLPYSKARTDQIDAALSELDGGKQSRIQTLIEQLEGHGEEIAEFRKDLPARYEEMTAKQEQVALEQYQKAIKETETSYLKSVESLSDKYVTLREVGDDVPGGMEWNKDIKDSVSDGLNVMLPDKVTREEANETAILGKHYAKLEKRFLDVYKENKELKKSLREYDSSGPDFKGGSKPTKTSDRKPAQKFHDVYNAIKRGEMADV